MTSNMESKLNLGKQLRKALEEFSETTSAHGPPKVSTARNITFNKKFFNEQSGASGG